MLHVSNPISAYQEMKRVLKPHGILADREGDLSNGACIIEPPIAGCIKTINILIQSMEDTGGCGTAGRRLHTWAHEAGFNWEDIYNGGGVLSYTGREQTNWWADVWTHRLTEASWGKEIVKKGFVTSDEVAKMVEGWEEWAKSDDAWFCHVVSFPTFVNLHSWVNRNNDFAFGQNGELIARNR